MKHPLSYRYRITKTKPKALLVFMARKEVTTRLTNSIFSYLLILEPKKIKKTDTMAGAL
nr:MAG TPA: hypothetical protein [Caudoviricetes sp.]